MRCVFCKFFLPVCGFSFYSLKGVFHRADVFNFNEVNSSVISSMDHACGVIYKKSLPNPSHHHFPPVLSSRNFIIFHLTFGFVMHFG